MRHIYRLLLLAGAILLVASGDADAQIFRPFFLHNGYAAAYAKAQDTLAVDSYLVYSGTFGDLDLSDFGVPLTLNFYQDPDGTIQAGQADAWGYVFYSPSKGRTVSLVVLNSFFLGGYFAQGVPVDLPLPDRLVDTLDLGIAGTHSDSLIARLKSDATYTAYHAQYPLKQPNTVTLGVALANDITPPGGFELGGPIWTLVYQRGGDTAGMVCLVSAERGQVVCRTLAAAAPDEMASGDSPSMRVLPNPASDRVRVIIDDPSRLRGDVRLELLDARGALVRDLSESLDANALAAAEIDATGMPDGIYFCRLSADGVSKVLPITLVHR
jgi:hypothetical protein